MARIKTYPLDTSITPNDYLLGTDGDRLDATKNYKVTSLIQQIGSQYNLQSMDLIYTFNAVDASFVDDGELSVDNYNTNPISASNINSIYVSKVTLFGQLVEEYIETVGAAGLTFTLVDLSNYNNFAICEIDSVSDINSNTLQLDVNVGVSNGKFVSGRTVGLKLDPAGNSVDLSGYVTLDTTQTITGQKYFTKTIFANSGIYINNGSDTSRNYLLIRGDDLPTGTDNAGAVPALKSGTNGEMVWLGTTGIGAIIFNNQSLTEARNFTFPDKSGTIALLDDVSATRSQFINYEVTTATVNVGAGLGSVQVGTSVNFPTDTQDGDVFEVAYTASWSPRNGKSFEVDNLSLKVCSGLSSSGAFNNLDLPLAGVNGNLNIRVDFTIYVIDVALGKIFWKYSASISDYYTTGEKNVNMGSSYADLGGDLIDNEVEIFATLSYADDGVSEGTLSRNQAIIIRTNT